MHWSVVSGAAGSLAGYLASFLAPPRCRLCGRALYGHANPFLCPGCLDGMEWIGPGACRRCGNPAGPYAEHSPDGCSKCRGRRMVTTEVAAVARYAGGAGRLVRALKFRGETELAGAMGGLMAERLRGAGISEKVDLVAPVGLHASRKRERGFDQAELLAAAVAKGIGAEYGSGWVRRVRVTPPQASLRRRERLANMEGVFEASRDFSGRTVVLVDDVMTTGATMSACAAACRLGGAARVYGVSFAR